MTIRTAAGLAAILLATARASAAAQDVGYMPANSPFRDLEHRQEVTVFGGYYAASADPVGVAPQSGPMLGLFYAIRLGGPAQFYARVAGVQSERTVLDPSKGPGQRVVEQRSITLGLADLGIELNVTGQKSWHSLVPVLNAGLGIASDFQSNDVGGFKLGTPFALQLGGGIRWVPGSRLQVRADVVDHLYQVRYPNSYFQAPSTNVDPIRDPRDKQNVWTNNAALTVGISWLYGR